MDSINTNIVLDLVSVHAGKVEVTNNFEAALDVISAFRIFVCKDTRVFDKITTSRYFK